jgi:hypothetical protein
MRRVVGLNIHRVFAEAVMLDAGKIVPLGRIGMTREHLRVRPHVDTRRSRGDCNYRDRREVPQGL